NGDNRAKRSRVDSADLMTMDDGTGEGEGDLVKDASTTKMRIINALTNFPSSAAVRAAGGPGGEEAHGIQSAPIPDLTADRYCVRIGLTLYKVQHSIYLLDFQKLNGDSFTFMTLCANIISELKTLSAASKLLAAQQSARAQQAKAAAAANNQPPPPPNR
ncbi:hypothetical protein TrRE_jg7475, partial [Triparma retinervis]